MLELDGDPHSGVFIRFSLAQAVVPGRVGLKPAAIECHTQAHVEGSGRPGLGLTGRHAGQGHPSWWLEREDTGGAGEPRVLMRMTGIR